MKALNPDAPAFTPGCGGGLAAPAAPPGKLQQQQLPLAALLVAGAQAQQPPPPQQQHHHPISAGTPPGCRGQLLSVSSTPRSAGEGSSLATPSGLGELASVLSDNLTFDDVFDHGSRRESLVEHLSEVLTEEPHEPAAGEHGGGAAADAGAAGAGSPARSCPVPIAASARASGGGGKGAAATAGQQQQQQQHEEAAAVAKAQADLNAEAGRVQCAAATDSGAPKLGPQDFEILRVVGQGAFGKVFQVRARSSGRVYAMKVMRKERILQRDHGDYVRAERDVLTAVVHPYIVTLRYSFQTPSKLYLVLDFINGGHLFFNLYRQGVFGEDVARLYTAEIVAALAYLHGRGIVHRDLKPENVLLDGDGHVRLTDFGLAKGDMGGDSRTNSFIGTMEYMAPEIISGSGHGRAVDWWSAGVLLYEMLAGVPPFRAKGRQQLQQQILAAKPKYPKFLSSSALSLLKGLLARDPAQRLGSGPGGAAEVKRHPFFKSISWEALEARRVESTFKPGVKCSMSVENFDKIWTEQRPVDSPCGTPTDPSAADAFAGFTYVAPSFAASHMAAALAAAREAATAAGGGAGEQAAV